MPEFRARFGRDVVLRLAELLGEWTRTGGAENDRHFLAACDVLSAYARRHEEISVDVSDIVPAQYRNRAYSENSVLGGVFLAETDIGVDWECFENVVRTRRSIRSFLSNPIPGDEEIEAAVSLARSTPSVCNRQTWKVHVYRGEYVGRVLEHQSGNRGFGHQIPVLLIVSSDMRLFSGVVERYQPWIECGLFSMNLMLALHARGIGSVALNWSQTNSADARLKCVADIPEHERIAMLIGCGYPAQRQWVPMSRREDTSKFITWHSQWQKK
jgi:nitroreductase